MMGSKMKNQFTLSQYSGFLGAALAIISGSASVVSGVVNAAPEESVSALVIRGGLVVLLGLLSFVVVSSRRFENRRYTFALGILVVVGLVVAVRSFSLPAAFLLVSGVLDLFDNRVDRNS